MIYESLQSTFGAVEELYRSLHEAVKQFGENASAAGHPEGASLKTLANRPNGEATAALTAAGQVITAGPPPPAGQPPAPVDLPAVIDFGLESVAFLQGGLDGIRTDFDALAGRLGTSGDRSRCEQLLDRLAQVLLQARQDLEEASAPAQGNAVNLARVRSTVDDLAAYPVLTSESGGAGGSLAGGGGGQAGGGTATGQVQRTVEYAVREVLGRLPQYTDPKAFTAALTASFELQTHQGHTLAVWRPRGFVGQTELGGSVTGAQASLYARAADALASAIPVLHGLTALRPDADVQEMDAARAVVESQFRAVVAELGTPGGPRGDRVDSLFRVLLEDEVVGIDNVTVDEGMLGYLASVFGLQQGQVNTIEEEQVFSNFLLLRDYIRAIQTSWDDFRTTFAGRDLGTRLVLLSNALQVVAEAVDEVSAALDSVFVGSAERTVARFATGPDSSMLVSELLSWISSFAAQEAPELVQQAGRRGMGAVQTTGTQLIGLVARLTTAITADPGLPAGMRHPRVRHPLEELRTYLTQVVQLAADVRRTVPTTP
jgi:hypothetical protein